MSAGATLAGAGSAGWVVLVVGPALVVRGLTRSRSTVAGRLAEVFPTASANSGTIVEAWSRDAAIVTSLALQHGVDPETLRKALTSDVNGKAAVPVGALLDLLAQGDKP